MELPRVAEPRQRSVGLEKRLSSQAVVDDPREPERGDGSRPVCGPPCDPVGGDLEGLLPDPVRGRRPERVGLVDRK
nr:hypothetical protein [Haloterrigena sp. H1]